MDYDYDLVSGKVNMVSYEAGKGDQFFYKYHYDADNRVVRSYTSRDKLIWTEDAGYNYYLHGPLARTELGQYKVQGVDYAYTLQGWLKGINSDSLSHLFDMAHDGMADSLFSRVSRDVYSFKLGYFGNEYTPIKPADATAFTKKPYTLPGSFENTGDSLFNGNISHTTLALSKLNGGATTGYSYGYDQLNRLVEMRMHRTNAGGGWSNSNIISGYAESIAYDANGNILKYLRRGANVSGLPLDMDSLHYKYNRDENDDLINNRLNHVRDAVSSGNYSVDIDDQSSNNYTYDRIGNLVSDVGENISAIKWTVYGKIKRIEKTDGTIITYGYDPGGNRTSKTVTIGDTATIITFYARDAQGNVMAVYTQKDDVQLKWSEQHLYGSSRLGMFQWDTIIPSSPPVVIDDEDSVPIYDSLMLGSRTYELSNHLGNVLSTISDKKVGHDNSGIVDYYIPEVLSQNDYYPFGMMMQGRKYSATSSYRYGFNGKENDNEVKGEGNQQDYGMRIYDPRLGRFLSVDPISNDFAELTPYQFAGNRPIDGVDLEGLEYLSANSGIYRMEIKTGLLTSVKDGKIVTSSYDYLDVLIVYDNIPNALKDPSTRSLLFTRGGPVRADGRDYDSKKGGAIVYPTGRYYNPGPDFWGDEEDLSSPSTTGRTQGTYSFKPDDPNNKSTDANKAAQDRIGSGAKAIVHIKGMIGNWTNQAIWKASSKEQDHRLAYYKATNLINSYLDNNLIPKEMTGFRERGNIINFIVDGTLPTPNLKSKKDALIYGLNIAWIGVQIVDQTPGLDLSNETIKSINNLINEYKKAGGGNEYDKIFDITKKENKH